MAGPLPPQKLCPTCHASVPDEAPVCPNCGYNFAAQAYTPPSMSLPPPPGYGAPPPGAPPGGPNPNWAGYNRYGNPSGTTDGMAIASLVLGIIALPLFCAVCISVPCAILALIFGGLSLKGNSRSMAMAGMVLGGLSLLLSIGFWGLSFAGAIAGPQWMR